MNDFRALEDPEFEISRRGYDREQVDAHLAEITSELARLRDLLAEQAGESDDGAFPEPVQAELDRVSVEVEAVIGAAREAAEGLRTRAAAEASKWREEADADARRWRAEAEEESSRLRADAASASERQLVEAQEESDKRRSDADAYATRIREEADAYASQTRQVAESEASQVREEADAYAASTRQSAEEDSTEAREGADAYAARVTSGADAYASSTREAAENEANETRAAAQSDASNWRAEAEAGSRHEREEAEAYAAEVRSAVESETARLTEEANTAAREMRASAEEYAAALRQSADAETTRQRAEAQAAAETARASVWAEATAILDNVAREVIEVRERGENEALAIIADGEQQSHRLVSQARQSSEEQRRSARIEADRLVGDAQSQHDEIIETANRAAAAAQERAQALERRREELMGQLEKTQQAMRTLEEELETRRETMREHEPPLDSSTVKVVPRPDAEELAGVRVIPSASGSASTAPSAPVTAEEIMDEVRSLREQREAAALPEKPESEAIPADGGEVEAGDEDDAEVAPVSDIDALFANLRETGPEPTEAAKPRTRPTPDVDPDDLRERLLLPLQNRAHKEVKRQLTEQQNLALEQIRLAGVDWDPDPAAHEAAFSPALAELVVESATAGYVAARELGIRSEDPPAVSPDDVDIPTAVFAADLAAAVAAALERSRSAGETSRKVSAAASKVYRSWRTDSAEHRLREMSDVAYADALRLALRAEGYEDTEWALGEWAAARHAS
ncbi:MAG: hypothetical protein HKO82_14990 [Acidimicrobiia bacterium]|nr:hypothetical protein [Acidimicrobiia bacterium]NNL14986.1 hypothetical protein [Acidimicrobiia bacterium]